MRTREKKPICPIRHTVVIVSAAVILLHRALRGSHALMSRLSQTFVRPLLRRLGERCAACSFSVAELLMAAAVTLAVVYILFCLEHRSRRGGFLSRLYRFVLSFVSFALAVYAGFCVLWGTCYYGDDFITRSGLEQRAISAEELQTVTAYFAALANTYAAQVPRDTEGVCATDRQEVLARSDGVFFNLEREYPCLEGAALRAKPVRLSRLLSYLDFTGFFFPFTGEANVNTDFPPSLFASTVAHELAHQRGVAKEQEANFVAVLACLSYGDPNYVYSAALMAYIHLNNALASVNPPAAAAIRAELDEAVERDLEANKSYWARFETPVQTASNSFYEGFLQSYDQTLGLKSYGACVDLLVNYYYEDVSAFYGGTA